MATVIEARKLIAFYKEAMRIDRNNLMVEIETHSYQHFRICEEAAIAKSKYDELKLIAETVKAKQRKFWEKKLEKGDKRVTIAAVDSRVDQDDLYLQALQAKQDQEFIVSLWSGLREASKERGRMFHELVEVVKAGYTTRDYIKPKESDLRLSDDELADFETSRKKKKKKDK